MVSIIIVNHNKGPLPAQCLAAIFQNPPKEDFEVLLVDNASTDGSIALAKQKFRDKFRLISAGKNLGYGTACNLGFRKARGDSYLVTNPDIEFRPGSIDALLEKSKSDPKIAIIGPQLIYPNGDIQEAYRRFPSFFDLVIKRTFLGRFFKKRLDHYLFREQDKTEGFFPDWIVGACLLINKNFVEKSSGFDRRFFLFLEDTDLCRHAWQTGWRVAYCPKGKVTHNHNRLSGGNISRLFFRKIFWIHLSSALKYFWKYKFTPLPKTSF